MKLDFHFGRKSPTMRQWVVYSVSTAVAVSLITNFGSRLLQSKHGEFIRDVICSVSKILPEGDVARLFSTACRVSKDGNISPDEAKTLIGRGQQVIGHGSIYFDNDRENTDLRAADEVSFAIENWKRLNPSPRIDPSLRKQFPSFSEDQLCVLSQAKRYVDRDAIGIKYVGMSTCEEDEVKLSFEAPRS